jgi:cobalt-zinc-cadmium efflux system outer membrane protein
VAKWNGARELVSDSFGLTAELNQEVGTLERLFDVGQTDLSILLQARQRLIQLRNAELDALWQATQAQADLLTALGAPALIGAMLDRERGGPAPASPLHPPAGSRPPSGPPSLPR